MYDYVNMNLTVMYNKDAPMNSKHLKFNVGSHTTLNEPDLI